MKALRLAVDLLGSDTPPSLLFEGVVQSLNHISPTHSLVVIARPADISKFSFSDPRIKFISVNEEITMEDHPLEALRLKKRSSLVLGMRLLNDCHVDALISAGNTGALVGAAHFFADLLPGVERPALLAVLPTASKPMAVLDVGGNVTYQASHLVQFAKMGVAYYRCLFEKAQPTVGLLNIGVESKKGPIEHQQAYSLLQKNADLFGMDFLGNVEGRDAFQGKVDVLVTDGFTGNVFLKTAEGTSLFVLETVEPHFEGSIDQLKKLFIHDEYPGAILCGISGIAVKCHGSSTPKALFNAIQGAVSLYEKGFIQMMKQELV